MNPNRLQLFSDLYKKNLTKAVTDYPTEYGFTAEDVPAVAARMRAAVLAGSYNKDGRAFKATCKQLGLAHTYTAINNWLRAATPETTE